MDCKVLLQEGSILQIKCNVYHPKDETFLNLTSHKYLCGAVGIEVQSNSSRCFAYGDNNNGEAVFIISTRLVKIFKDDGLPYVCKLSSVAFELKEREINGTLWHEIYCHTESFSTSSYSATYSFDLTAEFSVASRSLPIASLFEDTELTDFELRGEESSVRVHSAVLAGFSPVLKSLFAGGWKETTEGKVSVSADKDTLIHFKEYVYLDKLPESGIEELILLGSYYMIPDLVQKCTVKLLSKLNSDNIIEMTELAGKYQLNNLTYGILHMVKNGNVSIDTDFGTE